MRFYKLFFFFLFLLLFIFILNGFAQQYGKEIKERTLKLPHCEKPLGVIAARSFRCKAAACQGGRIVFGRGFTIETTPQAMGEGIADMLITALANTGCFKVVEREVLSEIKEELELAGIKPKTALKPADYIITGAITALEMQAGKAGGGGFVIPLPWKFGGGLKLGKSKAYIALDMRIVRVRDAQVLVAKTVEGKSERWKFGIAGGGLFGTTIGGGWFEAVKNTPLEEATRDLIAHAVTLIVNELKKYSPEVIVGEKKVVYTEKGEVVKEEIEMPATESKQEEISPLGEIKRPTVSFEHYKNIIWKEDFSGCNFIPPTVKIIKGHGECVETGGKKWFATTKGELTFEKFLPNFDPSGNWSLSYKIYFGKGKGWDYNHFIRILIGKSGSLINLCINRERRIEFSGQDVPNEAGLPDNLKGQLIKIGIKKEGEMLHLFINNIRCLSLPVDSVAIKNLPKKIIVKMKGEDIAKGDYVLVTDFTLSQE